MGCCRQGKFESNIKLKSKNESIKPCLHPFYDNVNLTNFNYVRMGNGMG